jgi:hypothetical protein
MRPNFLVIACRPSARASVVSATTFLSVGCQFCQLCETFPSATNLLVTGWTRLFGTCDQMRNPWRMIMLAVFLLLTVCAVLPRGVQAKPQDPLIQQNQSVVDAARRSREQKKNAAPPARVFTSDDLDREHANRDRDDFIVGALAAPQTESPRASAVAAAKAPDQAATSPNKESGSKRKESEEVAAEDAEIAKLGDRLASAQNSLFWQQRELLLDQNTVYTNPVYTTTHIGKAELDTAQLKIDQKQQEVDSLKGPLADVEWRQWRRMQASRPDNGTAVESYKSVPPSALVLPQP